MPNCRAKNKVHLGGYLDKELYDKILRSAKASGMEDNKFGFVCQVIESAIERKKPRRFPSR